MRKGTLKNRSFSNVWYINSLTWFRGCQDKLLYLMVFFFYSTSLGIKRKRNWNLINLQLCPESLRAMIQFWYMEWGVFNTVLFRQCQVSMLRWCSSWRPSRSSCTLPRQTSRHVHGWQHAMWNAFRIWLEKTLHGIKTCIIDHFTVVGLVTWPLNGSKAEVHFVLIQTSLLLLQKSSCSYAN